MGSRTQHGSDGHLSPARGALALLLVAVILGFATPSLLASTYECLAPAVTYSTGANPRAVALGDFNGDGRLDLVTANAGTNTASVLLGNGNGTFQAAASFPVGSN